MQNEQAFQIYDSALVENVCCYATLNDILFTRIHVTLNVSLTRPDNRTWKGKIKEMKVKHFIIIFDQTETKVIKTNIFNVLN